MAAQCEAGTDGGAGGGLAHTTLAGCNNENLGQGVSPLEEKDIESLKGISWRRARRSILEALGSDSGKLALSYYFRLIYPLKSSAFQNFLPPSRQFRDESEML
ncbi:hypothetical protein KUIN1_15930 [Pseudomonas sp. KUIN-1]|nr:hypothetical protein KUIN1_15930 [Pseudomonas sp. KUIN-1]